MKASSVKYRFVKRNFLLLFCMFIVPVFLISAVFIFYTYKRTLEEARHRMENTVNLALEDIKGLTDDSQTVNLYVQNSSLLLSMDRMMNTHGVSYRDSVILKQFSLFMDSIVNSRTHIDSIYVYLPNPLNRFFSSQDQFQFLDSFPDQDWLSQLTGSQESAWISLRTKKNYSFEQEQRILSVFKKFHIYQGGSVINYSLSGITDHYNSFVAYADQSIAVYANDGSLLFKNSLGPNPPVTDFSSFSRLAGEGFRQTSIQGRNYLVCTGSDPEYQLFAVSFLPKSALYTLTLSNAQTVLIILATVLLIIFLLAWILSLKSYHQLHQVLQWFEYARHRRPIPAKKPRDMYSQILDNILRMFIEQDYLHMQLSERKYRQQAASLYALQYQINPHFLFNTLQAINYEILSLSCGRKQNATRMLENLSDILRFSLDTSGAKSMVTLEEEIENCRKYIEIQQMRLQEDFLVCWDISSGLLNLLIPRLILQPLIENSFSHGFKGIKRERIIRICVHPWKNGVLFRIVDNGCGVPKDRLKALREQLTDLEVEYTSAHIGLQNCSCRLCLAYSPDSRIQLLSKEGMGFVVKFWIPELYPPAG